jgi:hypothetical protein
MPNRRSVARALALSGAAICSLFAGHLVQYQILAPDFATRSRLLTFTGHGYLAWAVPLAVLLGLVASLVAAGLGYTAERRGYRNPASPVRSGFYAGIGQVLAFVILETFERVAAGAPLTSVTARALLLGIALQVVCAALATLLLSLITSAGGAVAQLASSSLPTLAPFDQVRLPRTKLAHTEPQNPATPPRGPPHLLIA